MGGLGGEGIEQKEKGLVDNSVVFVVEVEVEESIRRVNGEKNKIKT